MIWRGGSPLLSMVWKCSNGFMKLTLCMSVKKWSGRRVSNLSHTRPGNGNKSKHLRCQVCRKISDKTRTKQQRVGILHNLSVIYGFAWIAEPV
jgi:hypothetical protein